MGMHERPDFYGCPEYYVDAVVECEPAGGGNIRGYVCAKRGNELVPLYTFVMSAANGVRAATFLKDRSSQIWNETHIAPALAS